MKTSFTQYLRGWLIHVIPILGFLILVKTDARAVCDASWSEVTMTINCEGDFNFILNNPNVKSVQFKGNVGTFWPVPIIHAASTYAPGSSFELEIICNDDSKDFLTGTLPAYDVMGGTGSGSYTWTGADGAGIVDDYTPDSPFFNVNMSQSSKTNPTCSVAPNDMDGKISIMLNGAGLGKCDDTTWDIQLNGVGPIITIKVGQKANFTGLAAGNYVATATVNTYSCPCPIAQVLPFGPIGLSGPIAGTTSIACNSKVNISVSGECSATILAMDLLRGVVDPCDPMMAMIDSLVVKSGGVFIGGSGNVPINALGVFIPDVTDVDGVNILGKPLKVEVHVKNSVNFCWGTVILEDKSPPIVTCNDPTLMEILCLDYDGSVMSTIDDLVQDCSDFTTTIIAQSEITDCRSLPDGILRRVVVDYFAVDEFNNRSNDCTDTLDVLRFDTIPNNMVLDVPGCILMPPDFVLDIIGYNEVMVDGNVIKLPTDVDPLTCTGNYARLDPNDPENPAPAPIKLIEGGSGFPRLLFINENGDPDTTYLIPLNYKNASNFYKGIIDENLANCNIGVDFDDLVFNFGCKLKIQRQWFLREWSCEGEQVLPLGLQEIIVTDHEDPYFVEKVPDQNFTVQADECYRFWNIQKPVVKDSCDTDVDLELAIYDADDAGGWRLIGPTVGPNGQPNMFFNFPVGMSWIVYTAYDDCGNQASDTTKITVMDNTPPVVICKEFLVVGISGDGNVKVPATSVDNGTYDQCGDPTICVTRMDHLDLLMSIDQDGNGEVLFNAFDDALKASADNDDGCYRDYSSKAEDRNGILYIDKEDLCAPYVEFCCADAGKELMIQLTASDSDGNVNRCMTFIELQDKNPAVITCLPNIIIDCDFDLPEYVRNYDDINDDPLSEFFGSIVLQGEQKTFGIPDEFILSNPNVNYVDGTIFDNCEIPRISVTNVPAIDNCGFGRIERRIFSHESGSPVLVCTQFIFIERGELIEGIDIIYPTADTLLTGCMTPEDIINESFGQPEVVGDKCSLIGISVENQIFLFNTQDQQADACFKIVRTFTIIDWCQSTSGNPFTIGRPFRQIIKVNDPDGPVISCSQELLLEVNSCDGGEVMLMATATDECTQGRDHTWTGFVESDEDRDGIFETFYPDVIITVDEIGSNESKATHIATYPTGDHRITWTVSDRCGNVESCVQNFSIVNTKKPTPFAIDISTVLMNTNGMVEVWAADLDNGKSEGPCGEVLSMSLVRVSDVGKRTDGGFGISTPSLAFTCADVKEEGIDVNYFVFYSAGNNTFVFDYTTVNIKIQDNNDVCTMVTSSIITGNIHSESRQSLPNISVDLLSTGNQVASALDAAMTDELGDYAFPAMPQGGSYRIDPSSTDDYLNGVTTLDLVMIQRYILGLLELESPYKILASDVNNDLKITTLDLVELRSVILGYKESFSNNESWRFIDETYVFDDPTFPFESNLGEVYNISSLSADMTIDFIGLKVGDVNGSVDVSSIIAPGRTIYNLKSQDQKFVEGEIVTLALNATQQIRTVGLQMALSFDTDKIEFLGIDANGINIGSEHIGSHQVKNGMLSISWNDYEAQNILPGTSLFNIQFRATGQGNLSEVVRLKQTMTAAEIYNEHLETSGIALSFNEFVQGNGFTLFQNTPNPFAENTQISFYLPAAADATLTISDITGRTIKNYTGSFDKGNNYISISKDELSASGVLYYTLETDEYTDTKRMVVLK